MNEQWLNTYRAEIDAFSEKIAAFQRGEIERKDYKGFSGGLGSYAQRDPARHMLRLRLPGGRLTVQRLKFISEAVAAYDIPKLKLTTCESIQMHDLTATQVAPILTGAIGCGIISRGGGGDNPRNVMCSPLSGVQSGEMFDVMPYAEAATQYCLSICRDIKMPRKLKISFSNGAEDSVHTAFRDMGFRAQADGTFALTICGGLGNSHRMGVLVDEAVKPSEVLYYIKGMIDIFCAHGNYENRAKARTRYLQEILGEDLKETYLASVRAAKAIGGLDLDIAPAAVTKEGEGTISHPRAIRQKQAGLYAVKYHPIGGDLPVDKPGELYRLLREMKDVECRVGPNETMYIINLTAAEAEKVLAATGDSAVTEFEHSSACIGAAICQQGIRDSQGLLKAAVSAVREAGIPDGALPRIVVSGCVSSCAAHQVGAIGFQGTVKAVEGKPQPAFKLFLGGSDALGAARFGEGGPTILEKDIPTMLVELGRAASDLGWAQWSTQCGEELSAIISKYA
ncbi:MAG: nitrite/sulfite reductase [Oscillibacter sp.]|nr:nitrite/sulfite reductase [Oscillibacter sp.]